MNLPSEGVVRELTDQAWERVLDRDPVTALRYRGGLVEALPRGGPAAMERDVSVAAGALARLAGSEGVQAEFLRDHLTQEVAEAERFWYRFPVTPGGTFQLDAYRSQLLAVAEFSDGTDVDRYLKLADDYAAVVEQLSQTMAAQRARGIRLPAWAVPLATGTVRGHAAASANLVVAPKRAAALGRGHAGRLADGVARVVDGRLAAGWRRLLEDLAQDAREGGDAAGIGQYPGGADCYAGLIRLHTGLDIAADRVHAIGLAEVERITARIRDELGVTDELAYRRRLMAEAGSHASSPAALERLLQGHVERLLPHLPRYFARLPAAPFRLRPLDASLSGLTYGFTSRPAPTRPATTTTTPPAGRCCRPPA